MGAINTVTDHLHLRAERSPGAPAYASQDAAGQWQSVTWAEVKIRVEQLASGLVKLGIKRGDRVAIMMPTAPEWEYCQLAALEVGGVIVGVDAHDSVQNLRHILETCRPRFVIAADSAKLGIIRDAWPEFEIAIVANAPSPLPGVVLLRDLIADRDTRGGTPKRNQQHNDLATIIFTSGSTGLPKGIAYTHHQVNLACDAILERFTAIGEGARLVCWLPLSNLFQRIINLCAMRRGAKSFFVAKPERIIELVPQIQPTLFIGVPRFFEKLYAGIMSELARRPAPTRLAVKAAWAIGDRAAAATREHRSPSPLVSLLNPLAQLVLARVRGVMGSHLAFMVSGSAPLPAWLLRRFHGLGWLVLEAYGTSENILPNAINTPSEYRFGSVGKPMPSNIICLADDSELLVQGPGVFAGYYGESEQSSTVDYNGFLHTGDFARIDDEGFVWIEGRKSEIFKTSTGRRLAPAPIEASLKQLAFVDHAMVVGHNRPYPIAIITIKPNHSWLNHDAKTLKALIAPAVAGACMELGEHQRPGAVIFSKNPFSITAGELTSNLKLRRKSIEARFAAAIDSAYQSAASASPHITAPPIRVIEAP